jgi:F0F1-type ATP synthase membrane subunit c/vacuolar-type H+-ATPase subunit K
MSGHGVSWALLGIGAIISVLVNWLKVSPLAFALGMFIPLPLNTPLVIGGLLNHWFTKSSKNEKINNARIQRGTLIASGFIAGAALFGVIGALLLFFDIDLNMQFFQVLDKDKNWIWEAGNIWPEIIALLAFCGLICYFIWDSFRAKMDD